MRKVLVLILVILCISSCAFAETMSLSIDGSHGKLSAVIQRPEMKDGEKCMMVMILHGFTGNKNEKLLTTLADALEAKNIASVRFDFNGHGESEGKFEEMTVLNEIEDAKKVFEFVKGFEYVSDVSVAGHSQGGVVTSMLAGELGRDNVKKIVLLAPAAVLREDAIRGVLQNIQYDPINPPEYIDLKSPHGTFRLGREYVKVAQTLPIYETAINYQGPACLIHGTGDTTVPYTYSLRYGRIYADSELHLLPKFDHSFTQDVEKTARIAADYLIKRLN